MYTASAPARRTASTVGTSPNLTLVLVRIAVMGSSGLVLILQIYSHEALGTGVPRHTHIPESAMLF